MHQSLIHTTLIYIAEICKKTLYIKKQLDKRIHIYYKNNMVNCRKLYDQVIHKPCTMFYKVAGGKYVVDKIIIETVFRYIIMRKKLNTY